MTPGLEPAFASRQPVWPLAGMALVDLEPDDPDLAIPHGALQNGIREAPERFLPANRSEVISHAPAEPFGPKPAKAADRPHKWKLALIASCALHAALALCFFQWIDDAVEMEGADFSGVAMLGEAAENQTSAGEMTDPAVDVTMVTMLEAKPVETVEAQTVPVEETVEATEFVEAETATVETVKPVETEPVPVEPQPVQPSERELQEVAETQAVAAVTETVPEVLATDRAELVEDDNFVQKPAEVQSAESVEAAETATAEAAEAAQPAKVEPVDTVAVAKAEPNDEKPVTKAEKKPASEKPAAQPKKADAAKKAAEKATAKPNKSGNGGQNQADVRRGQADGQEKGDSRQASRGGSKYGEVGNAAASNYPGKVRSKLARVARSIRAKGRGEVVVAFAVSSSGNVRSARVSRSSGVSSVDEAALQAIRKAAPFPPIPADAGRSTWEFSIPLAFMR